jgi:hypothetical protein
MTPPDARLYPRAAQWEAEGGANLKNYRLRMDARQRLSVEVPLLEVAKEGTLSEAELTLSLAASGPVEKLVLEKSDGETELSYLMPSVERTKAIVGSADLLVNRGQLSFRSPVGGGDVGSLWLKLSFDIQPVDPVADLRKSPPALHFQSALSTRSRHAGDVRHGPLSFDTIHDRS